MKINNNLVIVKQKEDGGKLVLIENIDIIFRSHSLRKKLFKQLKGTGLFDFSGRKKPRKQRRVLRRNKK